MLASFCQSISIDKIVYLIHPLVVIQDKTTRPGLDPSGISLNLYAVSTTHLFALAILAAGWRPRPMRASVLNS